MALPYFAFYPFDWLGDIKVQQLTLEETGAYINLLAYMWTHGHDCTLPLDDRMLSRVLHLPMDRWLEMRDILIDGESAVFTVLEDGTFTNKRIRDEYENPPRRVIINEARREWSNIAYRIRPIILDRDQFTCRSCGQTDGPLEIDHIVPLAFGGSSDLDNLQVLCRSCNRRKGASLTWRG